MLLLWPIACLCIKSAVHTFLMHACFQIYETGCHHLLTAFSLPHQVAAQKTVGRLSSKYTAVLWRATCTASTHHVTQTATCTHRRASSRHWPFQHYRHRQQHCGPQVLLACYQPAGRGQKGCCGSQPPWQLAESLDPPECAGRWLTHRAHGQAGNKRQAAPR